MYRTDRKLRLNILMYRIFIVDSRQTNVKRAGKVHTSVSLTQEDSAALSRRRDFALSYEIK